MKSHPIFTATAIALVAIATISLPIAEAEACSTLALEWSARLDSQFPKDIPIDGTVGLRASAEVNVAQLDSQGDDLALQVTDSQGDVVAGTIGVVLLREGDNSEPPGEPHRVLVHWTPDSDLEADATYSLTWRDRHLHDGWLDKQEATFHTTSERRPALEPATLSAATAAITETRAGMECCTDESLCDSCDVCRECWATRYAYLPTIHTTATLPDNGHPSQFYHQAVVDGEVRERWWGGAESKDVIVVFEEDAEGPFCVEFETISLRDRSRVSSSTECIERSDLPDYTERSPDESPPAECDVNDDADTDQSAGSSTDEGCGCAQTSNAVPGGFAGLLVWLGGLMVWRRCRR